jgi:choline dehydrogenase-like flavoprotein
MIRDLSGAGSVSRKADIVIVGAGTVGLIASVLLARSGRYSVICLESGGMHQSADVHPLNKVVHAESVYAGAMHGRFRCIGGTSTRWGGALIPFMDGDLRNADWPITMADLAPFVEKVEALFGLEPGTYSPSDFPVDIGASHVARLAKWPPFQKRNVYNLVAGECASEQGPEIWLNATVTELKVSDGTLQSVFARALDGSTVRVEATSFIVAAGAIETTRLALLLDQQNDHIVSARCPALGRYFSDHLSAEVAQVQPVSPRAFNRVVGFRFGRGGTMRNLRFELSNDSPARAEVPPCFAHIGFQTTGRGGFDALRDLFRHVQKRQLPSISVCGHLIATLPWLLRAVWWRFVEKRLLFPSNATLMAHMVIEQEAHADNRITLSAHEVDAFGVPLAQIAWRPSAQDLAKLTKAVDALEAMWQGFGLSRLARWVRKPAGEAENALIHGGGIYHPTGSTRMGASSDDSVVDRDLRVHTVPNLQLLATSVLPTGGGANPTMMLMLLAMRCVDGFDKAPAVAPP